jgi:phosphoenolpyruvate carboxykinase (ATP)
MMQPPSVYANLLGEKIRKHKSSCWLLNTGWTGGPFGVGKRMNIGHTRTLLRAALSGKLDHAKTTVEPVFGLTVPLSCTGVPPEVMLPRETWADKSAYDAKAKELAQRFKTNFEQFSEGVSKEVANAGPK